MKTRLFMMLPVLSLFCLETTATKDIKANTVAAEPENPKPSGRSSFMLGHFLIDTENKTVSNPHYWEKDEMENGELMHSWGTDYIVDTRIHPLSTCLYVFEGYFGFKEHYTPSPPRTWTPFEVEGYYYVNGLYEKEGRFYHLWGTGLERFDEIEIPDGVDFAGLTYAEGNPFGNNGGYLYDDTGLYFFRNFGTKGITKLAPAASGARPVVRDNFCEYNGEIFQHTERIGRVGELTEFDIRRDGDIIWTTNGKTVFTADYSRRIEMPGMDKWVQLTDGCTLGMEDGCVYFPASEGQSFEMNKVLFSTPDGLVLVDCYLRGEPARVKSAFVKTFNGYEPLDIAEYELYTNSIYVYKGVTYYGRVVINNDFDMPNLKWLKGWHGKPDHNWLSDGRLLTHKYLLTNATEDSSVFMFECVPVADIRHLKPINKDMLVDGVNFYQFTNRGIEVIPIDALWFDVEIDLPVSAYW